MFANMDTDMYNNKNIFFKEEIQQENCISLQKKNKTKGVLPCKTALMCGS